MASTAVKDPALYFFRNDVRNILTKVTGFDLKKIFAKGFNPTRKNAEILLLTQKQLEEENENVLKRARNYLQMPPFLKPRGRIQEILSKDERLNPLNMKKTDYMFIDISMNVPHQKRMIVVRESNGTLRKAINDEREKVLQVYFPREGKTAHVPQMFSQLQLEECLKMKNYMILLNKACVQFEPNDPDFIRVTHRIYDYVNEMKDYEVLYSTRFFGPMVFYLAWYKKLDNLVAYFLKKGNISDCVDVIKLFLILYGNETKTTSNMPDLDLIQAFIKNDLKNGAAAELAYKNYVTESTQFSKVNSSTSRDRSDSQKSV